MKTNELAVFYRNQYFEILAVLDGDGLYRASVAETLGMEEMTYWDKQTAGFSTAHKLLESYVGSIMEYVDAAQEETA